MLIKIMVMHNLEWVNKSFDYSVSVIDKRVKLMPNWIELLLLPFDLLEVQINRIVIASAFFYILKNSFTSFENYSNFEMNYKNY